jgi:hypothetical protein
MLHPEIPTISVPKTRILRFAIVLAHTTIPPDLISPATYAFQADADIHSVFESCFGLFHVGAVEAFGAV